MSRLRMPMRALVMSLLMATSLAGCKLIAAIQPESAELASGTELPPPAQICSAQLKSPAPVLKLPRTDAPRRAAKGDDGVDIAQIHTVNRPLQEIGVWNDQGDGWSVLALTLGSDRARSIAVRLRDVRLPKQSALWLCSVDGKLRQGPFTEAPNGELWTPSIASSQVRIELWTPTAQREQAAALLTDVYGGYQRP